MQSLQQRVRDLEAAAGAAETKLAAAVPEPVSVPLTASVDPALLLGTAPMLAVPPPELQPLQVMPARDQPSNDAAVLDDQDHSAGFRPFNNVPGQQPGTPTQPPMGGVGTPGARTSPTSSTATEDSSRPSKRAKANSPSIVAKALA